MQHKKEDILPIGSKYFQSTPPGGPSPQSQQCATLNAAFGDMELMRSLWEREDLGVCAWG
jgi:hypothetical protein